MRDATQLANDYIALWNERDLARRRDMLAAGWTTDATYVDPLMRGAGASEISALIDAVHARFPDFKFALDGKIDGHGDHVRFSWKLGAQNMEAPIKGTDFVVRDGDRIKAVTGFLDKVPAAA
jgi:hypothetical protein